MEQYIFYNTWKGLFYSKELEFNKLNQEVIQRVRVTLSENEVERLSKIYGDKLRAEIQGFLNSKY